MSKQNALTEPVYYILLSLLTPMHGYATPCSQRALLRNTKAIRPKRNISSQMTEEAY